MMGCPCLGGPAIGLTPQLRFINCWLLLALPLQVQKTAGMKGLPQLPSRVVKVRASATPDNMPVLAAAAEEKKFLGVPVFTWQKILPLGLMFFW